MYGHLPATGLATTPLAVIGVILTLTGFVLRKLGLRHSTAEAV